MPRRIREDQGLAYGCRGYLDQRWSEVVGRFEKEGSAGPEDPLDEGHELIRLIRASLRSQTLSYHYVLPTQLLAKSVDSELDVHSIQAGYGGAGSFDARTIAHDVIVPFDRASSRIEHRKAWADLLKQA